MSDRSDGHKGRVGEGLPASTRPLWKRLASRVRRVVYRAATPVERIARWRSSALLPPAHLRIYYYGTWDPKAFVRASDAARLELMNRGLRPEHRVLDIGSGIGNLALALAGYLHGGYDGVEIHPEAVRWCQQTITRRHPGFRFHRADLAGLRIQDVRRGRWWCGEAHDQDVLTVVRNR